MLSFIKTIFGNIKININKLGIVSNREEKSLKITHVDNSTKITFNNNISLSQEQLLSLSSEQMGDLVKKQAILNLDTAFNEKIEDMEKYLTMYTPQAIIYGATNIAVKNLANNKSIDQNLTPMPSGDFVAELPKAIKETPPNIGDQ